MQERAATVLEHGDFRLTTYRFVELKSAAVHDRMRRFIAGQRVILRRKTVRFSGKNTLSGDENGSSATVLNIGTGSGNLNRSAALLRQYLAPDRDLICIVSDFVNAAAEPSACCTTSTSA